MTFVTPLGMALSVSRVLSIFKLNIWYVFHTRSVALKSAGDDDKRQMKIPFIFPHPSVSDK